VAHWQVCHENRDEVGRLEQPAYEQILRTCGRTSADASRVVDQKSRVRSGYFGLLVVAHDTLTSQPRWISTATLQRSRKANRPIVERVLEREKSQQLSLQE